MCVSNKVRFRKILCIQTEPNVERGPSPSTSWGACRQTSRFVVGWQLSLAAKGRCCDGQETCWNEQVPPACLGADSAWQQPSTLGTWCSKHCPSLQHSSCPHRPARPSPQSLPPGLLSSLRSPPCSQRFGRICTWSDLPSHSLELICHSSSVTLCCHQQAPDAPRTAASVGTKDRGDQIRSKDQIRAEQSSSPSSPHKQHVCNQNAPSTIELALCKSGGNNGVGCCPP